MGIQITKNLSENEIMFQKLFPDCFQRYLLYLRYYGVNTGKDFEQCKDYDTVLVKSLVAYFLYQERVYNKKITKKHISQLMNYKDHTGTLYAIQRIKHLLMVQPKYKVSDKTISEYFLIFNGIFSRHIIKM